MTDQTLGDALRSLAETITRCVDEQRRIAARYPFHPDAPHMLSLAKMHEAWADVAQLAATAHETQVAALSSDVARLQRHVGECLDAISLNESWFVAAQTDLEQLREAVRRIADDIESYRSCPLDLSIADTARELRELAGERSSTEQDRQDEEREGKREEPDAATRNVKGGEQRKHERDDKADESERHGGFSFGSSPLAKLPPAT